jgi:aminocarboxymuconate-semialdehyde decarboxylase
MDLVSLQAAARLILSGVFDRYPSLKIILAHSGGALPALSSRLSSCIIHDPHVASRLEHDARFYMGQFYYDSACYGTEELEFVAKMIGRSERYKKGGKGGVELPSSIQLAAELKKGVSRIVGFSTDHPFFRPIESNDSELSSEEHPLWKSVTENLEAIRTVPSFDDEDRARIQGGNVKELFQFWD